MVLFDKLKYKIYVHNNVQDDVLVLTDEYIYILVDTPENDYSIISGLTSMAINLTQKTSLTLNDELNWEDIEDRPNFKLI